MEDRANREEDRQDTEVQDEMRRPEEVEADADYDEEEAETEGEQVDEDYE